MYTQLTTIRPDDTRSPVLFIHGFPDSPLMFAEYYRAEEQTQAWLQGRGIHTIAFPNRFTNPNYPPLGALMGDVLQREVEQLIRERIAASPTGKVILIGHDWGSTSSWKYIRRHQGAGIEAMVALSVASSFRYDVWEHGLRALGWSYSALFGLPWLLPIPALRRFFTHILTRYGGYASTQNETLYQDCYHYWYGLPRLLILPLDLLGWRYRPAYTQFTFPVLFMRSSYDRMPSTAGFEKHLQSRADCRFILVAGANHWFPEQRSAEVLAQLRTFLA